MRGFLLSLFITFYGTSLIPGIFCQQDGFKAFISNAANEFPFWIAENGLDPTPASPSELNLEHSDGLINITRLRIWNEIGTGYSSSVSTFVGADLLRAEFGVYVEIESDFNITAEYEVEGTVLSSVPITGAGKVITERFTHADVIDLNVYGFEITPNGYINMSAAYISSGFYFFSPDSYRPSFEDLSAGGFEEEVSRILLDKYKDWSMNQVSEYLFSYFEELFAKTPLSEIIGATYPPTGPPEETTPPMPTTSEAPPCHIFQEDGFTYVEGNVIDRNVTVNENGEEQEFVTKLVVFQRKLKKFK